MSSHCCILISAPYACACSLHSQSPSISVPILALASPVHPPLSSPPIFIPASQPDFTPP
jgi:hypothetical protein